MTMNLIRHGTKRAGFKDWPTYDNKPGPEEPEIARCAIPDPDWIQEPPPKTYNTNKTPTGEKIASKIRDLRLRRNLTGTTTMPRLRQKTHPMAIGASKEVDFEQEVARYKHDIQRDIEKYKKQDYIAPKWIEEALGAQPQTAANNETRTEGASSSSWEKPITDSQAVEMSDYLLTEQEAQEYLSENNDSDPEQPDIGPAWEHMWFR